MASKSEGCGDVTAWRSFDDAASRRFDPPAFDLAVDAPALRPARRLGRLARPRHDGGFVDQVLQARQCVLTILVLAAIALRLDDDHTLGGDAPVAARQQRQPDGFRQRRSENVKAQMDGRRHLVDVLASSALCADRGPLDIGGIDDDHLRWSRPISDDYPPADARTMRVARRSPAAQRPNPLKCWSESFSR